MLIDLKHEMMHDTAMPDYREPAGAAKTGESVTIRFKNRSPDVQSVYLRVYKDGYENLLMMSQTGDMWSVSLNAPDVPDVYWYYFCINISGRTCYYGAEAGRTSGAGAVYSDPPPAFQMTVYEANFDTPAWFKKSIMYQIFPDRFKRTDMDKLKKALAYHQQKGRKIFFHMSWNDIPVYKTPEGDEYYTPNDYFGGTLKGIEESLPYLKELGIGVIYLNPVFEAASNHRYNTADYMKIDPILGTNEDFRDLCAKAREMGIRILLDGVFSHTGSDSIYFNREGAYEGAGAYNSKESPYYSWYKFEEYPKKYKSWWGFKTLPEVNEYDSNWQEFMIHGDDSVLRHWISEGAGGYRLDVADELPDDVLMLMRKAVKQKDPEAVLIGEVWEDATTKHSYGAKRRFAFGQELDSVTNYPFRNAVVDFLSGKTDAFEFKDFLLSQAVNYPKPIYYSLMNLLSSHDIERIRSALSVRIDPHELSREQQASFSISDSQNLKGATLQRLAAAIQMTMPGVPCIYYGDEIGMLGFLDPFNRAPLHKGFADLTKYYAKLCVIRNQADALTTGHVAFLVPDPDCIGILRYIVDGRDVFGQPAEDGIYFTAINRSDNALRVVFDFLGNNQLVGEEHKKIFRQSMYHIANSLLNEDSYEVSDALLEMSLQPYSLVLVKLG